jgi:PAS domain S-box-containing protein
MVPENEKDRLKALENYSIMDTLPEEEMDRITELASIICETPIALVSLLDENRQWFKSKVGIDVPETPRDISFCQFAILGDDTFEVENAMEDERFATNPLVTGFPEIRFYAGYPLTDPDGFNLGTLCVIDQIPHKLSEKQNRALRILGKEIVTLIVNRKKAQELNVYKSFFENSIDLMSFKNSSDFLLKNVNESFSKTLGFTKEELKSMHLIDLCHPEDVEIFNRQLSVLQKGQAIRMEVRIKTKSGDYIMLDISKTPNQDGSEIYSIGKDITESKKIESELEKAKSELRAIFDCLEEGIVVQEMDGTIISCNPAACKILKMSEDQLRGKKSIDPDWRSVHEDGSDFPGDTHPAMMALKTGKSVHNVKMGVRILDGVTTWININAILLPDNKGVVCSFQDITSIKLIEENRLQLVKLEAKNKVAEEVIRAKEEFLANMSHEIRTPMNAIIGLGNLLSKAGNLNDKQQNYLEVIQQNSANLLRIVNDILDYSKLDAGKLEFEKVDFNLKQSILSNMASLKVIADKSHVPLKINFDPLIPEFVKGDSLRINQIVTNLVSNAIKFSHETEVKVFFDFVEETSNTIVMEVKVKDNGIGIPEEKLMHILQPFTQQTTSTTREYGGTGLGLSITSKLLEQMQSELIIVSEEGVGSEFSFKITLGKSDFIPEVVEENKETTKSISILLVEDNPFNQLVAMDTLNDWEVECNVQVADHGEAVFDIIQTDTFDVILLDVNLPDIDGYTIAKILREELGLTTPIVAMTAYLDKEVKDKCLAVGMNDFIAKPFEEKDLFETLLKWSNASK